MWNDNPKVQRSYNNLKNSIRNLYPEGLSEQEADEATRNFVGFGKLMLDIKCRLEHEKREAEKVAENST